MVLCFYNAATQIQCDRESSLKASEYKAVKKFLRSFIPRLFTFLLVDLNDTLPFKASITSICPFLAARCAAVLPS